MGGMALEFSPLPVRYLFCLVALSRCTRNVLHYHMNVAIECQHLCFKHAENENSGIAKVAIRTQAQPTVYYIVPRPSQMLAVHSQGD